MYNLKVKNGYVNCLLRSGKDFVKTSLNEPVAKHIIAMGKQVKSDRPDYPICVDNEWYFEGEVAKSEKEKKNG